jgi:hypothetical protein
MQTIKQVLKHNALPMRRAKDRRDFYQHSSRALITAACLSAMLLSSGSAMVIAAAGPPTGLTASGGDAQVILSWTAANGAASYNVYRSTASGSEGTAAYAAGIAFTSYTDTGLTSSTTYYYKVAAVTAGGVLAQSGETSASTAGAPDPANVYVGASIGYGFDFGNDTTDHVPDWVTDEQGYMECAYPAGQDWGAAFITTYPLTAYKDQRATVDVSKNYKNLSVDLRGSKGGESVYIGLKTDTDEDTGREPTYQPQPPLKTDWQTYTIPLSTFTPGRHYPGKRLTHVYVVFEIVFKGKASETVDFKDVRYTS